MSKSAIGLALAGALLFGVITIAKISSRPEAAEIGGDTTSAERERITAFWREYHSATATRSSGDFQEAARLYEQALRLNPRHEESLYYLGNCLLELGDYTRASEFYARLVEMNPQSPRGHAQLGVALSSLAPGAPLDFSRARESFESVLRINPEESGPYLRLGYLAFLRGDFSTALGHFETAARFGAPEGGFMAGAVLYHRGEYEESSRHFLKVLELNAREKEISGRGVLSEGDVVSSGPNPSLTPLESAGVKSLIHLYWSAARRGGYSEAIPSSFRLAPPEETAKNPLKAERVAAVAARGRGSWAEWGGNRVLVVTDPEGPLRAFRMQDSRWSDVTRELGLEGISGAWDASWGDYDGDGISDLYLIGSGLLGKAGNRLFRTETAATAPHRVRMQEVTQPAGLAGDRNTIRALFLDYDGDGLMDLLEVGSPGHGLPALRLYRNLGAGRFQEKSRPAGLDFQGSAVDCAAGDINGNGLPDLVVLRWRLPLLVFENRGDGTFQNTTTKRGLDNIEGRGFSLLFFDYDRDGRQDLLITAHAPYDSACLSLVNPEIRAEGDGHRLFRATADGVFQEITREVGIGRLHGTMQAAVLDVDQDGWPDLVLAGGGLEPYRLEPTLILRNDEGREFVPYSLVPGFDSPLSATGVAALPGDRPGEHYLHLGAAGLFRLRISD
jgi:tetratricopeptide (TPR) repeat protein